MAKATGWKIAGVIPIPLKGADEWSGDGSLNTGRCQLEVLGYKSGKSRKGKKMLSIGHKIVAGPVDGSEENQGSNVGREIRADFYLHVKDVKNYLRHYANSVAPGGASLSGAEEQIDIAGLATRRFWCNLVAESYKDDEGNNRTSVKIQQSSIEAVEGTGEAAPSEMDDDDEF